MEHERAAALLARLHETQGELYAGGDDAAVREVLTSDVVSHVPGDNAIARDYHGIDQVLAYFRHRRDLAESTFTMTPRELLVGPGDHAAALTDGTAIIGGRRHTWSTIGLYRITQGRIAECWLLPLNPEAFDAIWARRRPPQMADAAQTPTSVFHTAVRPRHCDAQAMLHASRYYEYFEDAFLDWLEVHLGGYAALRAAGTDLVVVASGCDHHRGATLSDRLAIEVQPVAAGRTSITIAFTIRRAPDDVLAVGHTTYVCVSADGPVALPESLRALTRNLPRAPHRPGEGQEQRGGHAEALLHAERVAGDTLRRGGG